MIAVDELNVHVDFLVHNGFEILQDAFVETRGSLFVSYGDNGECNLLLTAWRMKPQPGDPGSEDYALHAIGNMNPGVDFTGVVTSVPLDAEIGRLFMMSLRVFRQGTISNSDMHCFLPSGRRWVNTPTPQIGRQCEVHGDIIGLFRHNGRTSALVEVYNMNFQGTGGAAPLPPAVPAASTSDARTP